jgi:hypothetical protein
LFALSRSEEARVSALADTLSYSQCTTMNVFKTGDDIV